MKPICAACGCTLTNDPLIDIKDVQAELKALGRYMIGDLTKEAALDVRNVLWERGFNAVVETDTRLKPNDGTLCTNAEHCCVVIIERDTNGNS